MFHIPMSSPMMKRMFGFLSCAWLGVTTHISAANAVSRGKLWLSSLCFTFCFLSLVGFDLNNHWKAVLPVDFPTSGLLDAMLFFTRFLLLHICHRFVARLLLCRSLAGEQRTSDRSWSTPMLNSHW